MPMMGIVRPTQPQTSLCACRIVQLLALVTKTAQHASHSLAKAIRFVLAALLRELQIPLFVSLNVRRTLNAPPVLTAVSTVFALRHPTMPVQVK